MNFIKGIFKLIAGLFVFLVILGTYISMNQTKYDEYTNQAIDNEMAKINNKVADDSIKQYEIVKRNGSAMESCVHAGFVAAAYIQAKDEANYKIWHDIEISDCAKAGINK